MLAWVLGRKSAGVSVKRRTWKHIQAGNAARDEGRWRDAAHHYQAALAFEPQLDHVLLQHGHALKELGSSLGARAAYARANSIAPDCAEPLLHLGHLAKRAGDHAEAADLYLAAVARAPDDCRFLSELLWSILNAPLSLYRHQQYSDILGTGCWSVENFASEVETRVITGCIYDISNLLAHMGAGRRPSGIQRVQAEIVSPLLNDPGGSYAACFVPARNGWVVVPSEMLLTLLAAMKSGEISVMEAARHVGRLYLKLATAPLAQPTAGSWLVSLSPSWSDPTMLACIADLKRRFGVRYAPLVYDVIPVILPQFFERRLVEEFSAWIKAVVPLADKIIAISRRTADDLVNVSRGWSRPVLPGHVTVLPLNVGAESPAQTTLRRLPIEPGPAGYVLMVSTIEPRKNHIGAFAAWEKLLHRLGPEQTPLLVCVGGGGWLNAPVYACLNQSAELRRYVRLLLNVADDELAELYRLCLCTLYPSFYEGWGLPVTESLAYGKIPVISSRGSLGEAGGDLAIYINPDRPDDIADAIEALALSSDDRIERENRIAREFRAEPWNDLAERLQTMLVA